MNKTLLSSAVLLSLLLVSMGIVSAVNFSRLDATLQSGVDTLGSSAQSGVDAVSNAIRQSPGALGSGLSAVGQGFQQAAGQQVGRGFYMKIYEQIVAEPNKKVKEQLNSRFAVNINLRPQPLSRTGSYTFLDLYEEQGKTETNQYVAELTGDLSQICRRYLGGMMDDQVKALDLLAKRLQQKQEFASAQELRSLVNQINTLLPSVPAARAKLIQQRLEELSALDTTDQQVLLNCERDLRDEIGFESRLQTLLNPSRTQLEALYTFMNGQLEDYGFGLPKYDLLLDIDVIEAIFFGTGISSGISGDGRVAVDPRRQAALETFQELTGSAYEELPETTTGVVTRSTSSVFSRLFSPFTESFITKIPGERQTLGFGTGSSSASGAFCPDDIGLNLNYNTVGRAPAETSVPSSADSAGTDPEGGVSTLGTLVQQDQISLQGAPAMPTGKPDVVNGQLQEGNKRSNLNAQSACQGTTGLDFGNDLLRLVFCLTVEFKKVGKTWTKAREDCIACQVYAMNQIFEEQLLSRSVRPHKNTGTIMESAICEDGYGDDVGFFSFIEWVPVKFYPDICYPSGGVTNADRGEIIGYPEILAKLEKPAGEVECEVDFKDEEAKNSCFQALNGIGYANYDYFKQAYLDRSEFWTNLVGERGQAERELHDFLYRLGKVPPVHGEEEQLEQDLLEKRRQIEQRIGEIRNNPNLIVSADRDEKTEELLCLKGYFRTDSNCLPGQLSIDQFERELFRERERVMTRLKRYNQRQNDFSQTTSCSPFALPGLFEQLGDFLTNRVFDADYYLDTRFRRTQTPVEKLTGQITTNTDIDDIDTLLSTINSELEFNQQSLENEVTQREFEGAQDQSRILAEAFGPELNNFRTIMTQFTDLWSEMVDKQQFVSKSGKRINALESFLQKVP